MTNKRKADMYDPLSENFKRREFPFYWIAQINALYSQEMERLLKRIGMDVPRWRIIMILKEHSELSISDIASQAVAKLPTTTKIVYRMRDEGLVNLVTSSEDGRVTLVSLTDKGLESLELIRGSVSKLFRRSFEGVSSAEIQRTNVLLSKLFDNLKALSD
ncbi:Winged helix-turn-helix transcriptional regulator [Pseudomonas sp. OF001]|jgi:DNA-binding MarR family transcriptional regulator|uniref:MarR family winged helix-turn-helix transcriptional regulator n=1 Tax=unclassified Pseudomonas TaxID=196821 RepID=UPI0010A68CDA|nr:MULTISPECIES: MarR family winged helix-turn-helix transcriptional regulator [unclassified Pseudomonas]THG81443.1 winged helix-turn-helix transcriptional regulator [Pseudomonas sp. A-1]WPP45532.1 MarR family winged helix-turn-helix transcriptional regulator [Pseudomonas sp. AN-1]CAD5375784.1 Winged helix-turn-helix transcriptional regulator [Pseudomonas sp. OF001]